MRNESSLHLLFLVSFPSVYTFFYVIFHYLSFLHSFFPKSVLSRFAVNLDSKEGRDWKEGKEWKEANTEGKVLVQSRPVSVMSSLSYRKRPNLTDSIGGKKDNSSLFSPVKENFDSREPLSSLSNGTLKASELKEDHNSVSSRWKSQTEQEIDGRSSVNSQAYSEASSRARKGVESRWGDFESSTSSIAPSRTSACLSPGLDSDTKSTLSQGLSMRHSGDRSPGNMNGADSRMSLAFSCRLSEFDDLDDRRSFACSERSSAYSPPSSTGRSLSMPPPRVRLSTGDDHLTNDLDIKSVSHRNYLDPDLEKAINEVLSFKPIKFKRSRQDDSEAEGGLAQSDDGHGNSVHTGGRQGSNVQRSVSAVDCRSSSSMSSPSHSSKKGKKKKKRSRSASDSSDDNRNRRSRSKKKGKRSKKKEKSSSSSGSDSESDSSSGASTISCRSSKSVKQAPTRQASSPEEDREVGTVEWQPPNKKEEKKRKKKVDNLMMMYLYRPDSN